MEINHSMICFFLPEKDASQNHFLYARGPRHFLQNNFILGL